MSRSKVMKNDVLLNITGASIGRCAMYNIDDEANVNQHVAIIRVLGDKISPHFLTTIINDSYIQNHINRVQAGGSREALNYTQIKQFEIPLPPLSIQQEIVTQIQAEQEMVNANKKLIEIYEQKIKDKIGEVWGE
jgi:type I restriction enzyme S subunit